MATLRKGKDKSIEGVCSGLAEFIGIDVTIFRAIYVLLTLCTKGFPGFLLYLILAIIMPENKD